MKKIILMMMALTYALLANEIGKPFVQMGHRGQIDDIEFSPDGKLFISKDSDIIKLWDVDSQKVIRTFHSYEKGYIELMQSNFGINKLISLYDNGSIIEWDTESGKILKKLQLHDNHLLNSHFDLYDKTLIYTSENKIKLYDIESEKIIKTADIPNIEDYHISSLSVLPDGKTFVFNDNGAYFHYWDIDTLKEIKTFKQKTTYNLSPLILDGKSILYIVDEHTAKLIDIKSGQQLKTFYLDGEYNNLGSLSPNGKTFLVISGQTINLIDIESGKSIKTYKSGNNFSSASFSPNGDTFISGDVDGNMSLWDIKSGKTINKFDSIDETDTIVRFIAENIKLLEDGGSENIYATYNVNNREDFDIYKRHSCIINVELHDIKTKKVIKNYKFSSNEWLSYFYVDISDNILIGAGESVRVWDLKTLKLKKYFDKAFCTDLSYYKKSKMLITANGFSSHIFDIKAGKEMRTIEYDHREAFSVAINPNGKTFISGGYDGNITLFDIKTGKEIDKFMGHNDIVTSLAFSPDGKTFFSGSGNGEIILWNIKSHKEIHRFKGSTDQILNFRFSADTEKLISFSRDNSAKLWDIATGKEIAQFVSFDDGEWVVITPEGYFDSSLNGYKNLNILTAPMSVSDIGIFYDVFYRPDIVKAKLAGEDITKLVGDMTFQKALENPSPKISIGLNDSVSDKKEITIPYTITSSGGGISEVRIFQNGKLVHGDGYYKNTLGYILTDAKEIGTVQKGDRGKPANVMSPVSKIAEEKSSPHTNSITIPLIAGEKNEISVMAFNKTNTVQSNPATVTITSTLPKEKGKLWVLGVGLDEYHEMDMLNYAVKDVKDFVCLYAGYGKECKSEANAKSIFGDNIEVEAYLTDNNATKANILKALNSIAQKAQPQDSFVWFQSGHGILDADGNYHIVTFDTNLTKYKDKDKEKEMLNNTLNSNDILEVSKNIKAMSQLIVLDTCHAGGLDGKMGGLYDGRMSKLMKNMGVHLYAAAEPEEKARETKENQHGTFTSFLLEGLKSSMPDTNKDSQISIIELGQYAVDKTIEHEAKKQNENERQTPIMRNFGEDRAMYKK